MEEEEGPVKETGSRQGRGEPRSIFWELLGAMCCLEPRDAVIIVLMSLSQ